MSLNQKEDFNGRIAKRVTIANMQDTSVKDMTSALSREEEGIDEYLKSKRERTVEEHKSMLDEFQL